VPVPTRETSTDHVGESQSGHEPGWTFLTNHAHVLVAISRDPDLRQREIGQLVGITEGAVHRIVHELEEAGYVQCERIGRRNRYRVVSDRPLRHPLDQQHLVADLLAALQEEKLQEEKLQEEKLQEEKLQEERA
jgi:DNA-binding MarR family transcriptional regulator